MKNILTGVVVPMLMLFLAACGNKGSQENAGQHEVVTDSVETRRVIPDKYCNDKYDFCISYPQADFKTEEGSETEDGITLISNDGFAKLVVHTGNLTKTVTEGAKLQQAYDEDTKQLGEREVTYKSFKTTNYVLMGYENKTIFYQKTIISGGSVITAILYYDDKAKDTYYPMIQPIFRSFE